MSYRRLQAAKGKSVGSKQTVKALKKHLAKVVYVADNADRRVVEPIIAICEEKQIPFIRVDTMKNLGKACSIKVDCAAAAILEEN